MTRTHMHAARSTGFTIIELMVTISVLAVLLGIGVPAFSTLIRNSRLATQTNSMVGALNYARGEVATRGMPVAICAAAAVDDEDDPPACADATNWVNGWLVFTDRTGEPGVLDGTDEVLQTGQPPTGGFAINASAAFVRFGIRAGTTAASSFLIRSTDTSVCASTGTREIAIALTGRISTTKGTC